jgi:hypothetical protein
MSRPAFNTEQADSDTAHAEIGLELSLVSWKCRGNRRYSQDDAILDDHVGTKSLVEGLAPLQKTGVSIWRLYPMPACANSRHGHRS